MVRRSRHQIIRDLLIIARDGTLKTRLVYQGNLNFRIVKKYLDIIMRNELMVKTLDCYFTTDKGLQYIDDFNRISHTI